MIVFLYVCSTISKPRRLFHVIVFSFLIKQSIHQIYTYVTNAIPHDLSYIHFIIFKLDVTHFPVPMVTQVELIKSFNMEGN